MHFLYFQEKAKSKMCECCPPLPYCSFEALVRIEFYMVDMCMERFDFYSAVVFAFIAYSCHWEWANVSAVVLVIAVGTYVADRGDPLGALLEPLLGIVPRPRLGTRGVKSVELQQIFSEFVCWMNDDYRDERLEVWWNSISYRHDDGDDGEKNLEQMVGSEGYNTSYTVTPMIRLKFKPIPRFFSIFARSCNNPKVYRDLRWFGRLLGVLRWSTNHLKDGMISSYS